MSAALPHPLHTKEVIVNHEASLMQSQPLTCIGKRQHVKQCPSCKELKKLWWSPTHQKQPLQLKVWIASQHNFFCLSVRMVSVALYEAQ